MRAIGAALNMVIGGRLTDLAVQLAATRSVIARVRRNAISEIVETISAEIAAVSVIETE